MSTDWTKNYQAANTKLWQGRNDQIMAQRFYQIVQCVDISTQSLSPTNDTHFALLGFCCDEGVRRNQGREGAAQGPDALRQALANMAWHHGEDAQFMDVGNIICDDGNLHQAQLALSECVKLILAANMKPILIGGGHEIAWGHYQGLQQYSEKPLGIINFDAHFDLRPYNNTDDSNSGTPFRQIADYCQSHDLAFDYACFGIQQYANTPALFEYAHEQSVQYVLAEDIHSNHNTHCHAILDDMLNRDRDVYLTICLDVFDQCYVPGVSAPATAGLTPWQVNSLLRFICQSNQVLGFDIAELSPQYDLNQRSAKLAAWLVMQYCLYNCN